LEKIMREKVVWKVISALWLVLGVVTAIPALMAVLMGGGAPHSTFSTKLGLVFAALFPVSCLCGAIFPWKVRDDRLFIALFLLPVSDGLIIALFSDVFHRTCHDISCL
jgi:hypothetical protein